MIGLLFKRALVIAAINGFAIAASGGEETRLQRFRAELEAHRMLLNLPGLAVGVMRDGDIVFREDFGYSNVKSETPIRPDSVFPIASVTKTFSAVMLMQYVRENQIDLDDRITSYPFISVGFFPQRVTTDVRLRHILSHTSESVPGTTFIYHGGRFNFVSGVFQGVRGEGSDSFMAEIQNRIVQPLGLESTFPRQPRRVEAKRIVTSYKFDQDSRRFVAQDRGPSVSYPATGMLSTVDDLLKYSLALDRNSLIDDESYNEMTRAVSTSANVNVPYGLGWFTQAEHGVTMHWAYGLGDSDSALVLRIPELKLTLVVLSNCSFASEPFRLGAGNALNSPLVVSFLKHFVLLTKRTGTAIDYDRSEQAERFIVRDVPVYADELCAQVFSRTFAEQKFDQVLGAGKLLDLLIELDPARFSAPDPSLMNLLSYHPKSELDEIVSELLSSCRRNFPFHPEVEFDYAKRLERKGRIDEALNVFRAIADFEGFEEQAATINASNATARLLRQRGNRELARDYEWRSVVYSFQAGYRIDRDLIP